MRNNYLKECLELYDLKELPELWDGEREFEKAICLCKMRTGLQEYIIVGLDEDKKLCGKKTFSAGIIESYGDVYPVDYGAKNEYAKQIKVKFEDMFSDNTVGEWGIPGIYTADQAYDWVVANRRGAGNISRKPEKIKEKIKEILNCK